MIGVLLLGLGLAAAEPGTATQHPALLGLVGDGFSVDELATWNGALRKELEKTTPRLQREATTKARLDDGAKRGLSCDRAAAVRPAPQLDCLLQAALLTEADPVIAARLTRLDDGQARLLLLQIDVTQAAVARAIVRTGTLDGALFTDASERLAGRGDATGRLIVDDAVAGLVVLVDGQPMIETVAAGPHELTLAAPGHLPGIRTVIVDSGGEVHIDGGLAPEPPAAPAPAPPTPPTPPGPSPLLLGVGGAAAAVGVVAIGAGVVPGVLYVLDAQALAAREAELRGGAALAEGEAAALAEAHGRAAGNLAAWQGFGEPLAVCGVLLVGLGAGVVAATLWPTEPSAPTALTEPAAPTNATGVTP